MSMQAARGMLIEMTGKRFGRLVVMSRAENNKRNRAVWNCKCDCGKMKKIDGYHLRCGDTVSCGCFKRDMCIERSTKHGLAHTDIYHVWVNMMNRCYCVGHKRYDDWGGRGIIVCDKWHDVKVFYKWAESAGHNSKLLIDRIDNNGNYEPSNCRFVTPKESVNNRRCSKR